MQNVTAKQVRLRPHNSLLKAICLATQQFTINENGNNWQFRFNFNS